MPHISPPIIPAGRCYADGVACQSKLNMVDLAGSERSAKTGAQGATAKEARHINKSLTFLEQVLPRPVWDHSGNVCMTQ